MENIDVNDKYDIIKEKMKKFENGKYKEFILEKEDFEFVYAFPIFDYESQSNNKTLDAISFCKNLHEDYYKSSKWIIENTSFYPGLLNLDIRLFIIVRKHMSCIMLTPNKNYDVLFKYIENKEDGELLCISLEFSKDKFAFGNIGKALEYYFNLNKLRKNLIKVNESFLKKLDKCSTIPFKY